MKHPVLLESCLGQAVGARCFPLSMKDWRGKLDVVEVNMLWSRDEQLDPEKKAVRYPTGTLHRARVMKNRASFSEKLRSCRITSWVSSTCDWSKFIRSKPVRFCHRNASSPLARRMVFLLFVHWWVSNRRVRVRSIC